jgi:hypothetical protein
MAIPEFTAEPVETVCLLPIYILCDTSQSMEADGAIEKMNEGLSGVVATINHHGVRGDDIRLCVITFATKAAVALPLTKVEMSTTIPTLRAGGVTNLPHAIEVLSSTLSKDYHAFRDAGQRAYRPGVFVFTDGRPTDGQGNELDDNAPWLDPLNTLKNHPIWAPRIYAYGFGKAQKSQLDLLVSERDVSDKVVEGRVNFTGAEAAASIERLFPELFKTITEAADAAASGATEDQIGKALDSAHANTNLAAINPDEWWGSK